MLHFQSGSYPSVHSLQNLTSPIVPLNDGSSHSSFAVISADGDGVPLSFPLGNDGLAYVTSLRLNLRFWLSEDFIFVDEEVYDALSGDLINTI